MNLTKKQMQATAFVSLELHTIKRFPFFSKTFRQFLNNLPHILSKFQAKSYRLIKVSTSSAPKSFFFFIHYSLEKDFFKGIKQTFNFL